MSERAIHLLCTNLEQLCRARREGCAIPAINTQGGNYDIIMAIGNAHGFYKGKPDIHLEVLEPVRSFCDLPLVLHGCTGMDEAIIRKAVREPGIA